MNKGVAIILKQENHILLFESTPQRLGVAIRCDEKYTVHGTAVHRDVVRLGHVGCFFYALMNMETQSKVQLSPLRDHSDQMETN